MEDTIDQSQPVELYEFISSYDNYYYTSDNVTHVYSGKTYVPLPGLERSSLRIGTQDDDRNELSVSMPITAEVAINYAFQITPPSLQIVLKRFDRATGTPVQMWKGPVGSTGVSKDIATFKCPNVFSNMLQARIPTIMVQPQCNHALYDERCKVPRASHTVNTTVTNVNGRAITVASLGSHSSSHFVYGEMVVPAHNEHRTIVSAAGNVLTVSYLFGRLEIGDSIEIAAGCDHGFDSPNGCMKFGPNWPNFGGFPWVPGEFNNVFRTGIQ